LFLEFSAYLPVKTQYYDKRIALMKLFIVILRYDIIWD
jgi:hypothetical protein